MKTRLLPIGFIAAVLLIALAAKPKENSVYINGAFDTVSTITTYAPTDNTAEYEEILREADLRLSAFNSESEIYRLNHGDRVQLSQETVDLLCDAVSYTNMLTEYFDISINPLCELWTAASEARALPDNVAETLSLVGAECLNIDIDTNTAEITKDGASITLGAIAKGDVTDKIVNKMRKNGETSALINLGGNIYAYGKKDGKTDWKIGLSDPKANDGSYAATLDVSDTAVVTSGSYQRYFELNGEIYHHIIDPETGYPANSGLLSATVIGKDAVLCDVLSTAMFVAGAEKAAELAEEFDVDAVLITENEIYYTGAIAERITQSNNSYTLKLLKNSGE